MTKTHETARVAGITGLLASSALAFLVLVAAATAAPRWHR